MVQSVTCIDRSRACQSSAGVAPPSRGKSVNAMEIELAGVCDGHDLCTAEFFGCFRCRASATGCRCGRHSLPRVASLISSYLPVLDRYSSPHLYSHYLFTLTIIILTFHFHTNTCGFRARGHARVYVLEKKTHIKFSAAQQLCRLSVSEAAGFT